MKTKIGIGVAIASIAAVLTMGAVAPASAGQKDDYARRYHNDNQGKGQAARRKWQKAHYHSHPPGNAYGWNHNGKNGTNWIKYPLGNNRYHIGTGNYGNGKGNSGNNNDDHRGHDDQDNGKKRHDKDK